METLLKRQRIISEISEQNTNLYIWADAFIIDRKAQNSSPAGTGKVVRAQPLPTGILSG